MRPFRPTTDEIARRIVARVVALPDEQVSKLLGQVLGEFADRHEQVENVFRRRFAQVMNYLDPGALASPERQRLLGAYFTKPDWLFVRWIWRHRAANRMLRRDWICRKLD